PVPLYPPYGSRSAAGTPLNEPDPVDCLTASGSQPGSAAEPSFELCNLFRLQRPAEMVALHLIAARQSQIHQLLRCLHPFGYHLQRQALGQGNGRGHYDTVVMAVGYLGDQAAVDLELVHRQGVEMGEARITLAEIIQTRANACA